ncbi:amidohydrolase [Mycetocola reblochoni]|uniref:Probable metal-dependant glycoprotease n=1 Tax=Mycetocola reblochoni REB411 TaxID=1255698 RepID=A0A1R4KAB8_9MICO|nr:amidohydrolase [Mycetocola reblochoni]SJN41198.1 probable metal-dependant glycoprotease [Mycetocola reblochoni REB411]
MPATLFRNGLLYLGAGRVARGSLLVVDDRIAEVTLDPEDTGAAASAGPGTAPPPGARVIDIGAGTLLPGFQDAHAHPVLAGTHLLAIDLTPVHDRSAYLDLVAAAAAADPDATTLTGGGWFGDVFDGGFPRATELDEAVTDRPVILSSHDAHGVWVNSAALRAAGIDASTPDPDGGRILRDADGTPSGTLLEAAVGLVAGLIPPPTPELLPRALAAAQRRLHAVGVTAWQDAAVGESDLGPDVLPAYEALDASGELTASVRLALWWDRGRGLEQIDDFLATRDRLAGSERLDAGAVKVMVDGMVENHTAGMLAPLGGTDDDRGITFIAPDDLARLTTALDAAGFQVHFHACGDAAVRSCLDAVQAAVAANGPLGNRHHIAHLDVVAPEDVPRFAALDVTANVTGLWARTDEEIVTRKLPLLGPERERQHFPFGSLHRAGARIVGGSDWPVTDPNPLWSVATAVTRTGVAADPHAIGEEVFRTPLLAEEALPLGVALDAYLSEAARINGREHVSGRLEEGAVADLVLLDADVSSVDAVADAGVRLTMVGGRVVHEG